MFFKPGVSLSSTEVRAKRGSREPGRTYSAIFGFSFSLFILHLSGVGRKELGEIKIL